MAILCFLVWFYPVGIFRNAEYSNTQRSGSTLVLRCPANMTCGEHMQDYISANGGYLLNSGAQGRENCHFCSMESTNAFLHNVHSEFSTRRRDFGCLWVYVVFNTAAAIFFYWLCRLPKEAKRQ
jgi:ABC-type multidrug transport system permease subunit